MYIKNLKIKNFRNYSTLDIDLHKGINIIYGNNAQGKTNLLEAIYVLALTKSHRSFIDNKLIQFGMQNAIVKGKIKIDQLDSTFEIILQDKSKKLKIDNNIISKISDYISKINIIIFYPEDLDLVKGSPSIRRKFLNLELSQLDYNYYDILLDFNKLLKMRNDYLKKISFEKQKNNLYLETLNHFFIQKSILIYKLRNKYIYKINQYCKDIYKNISGIDHFIIKYHPFLEMNQMSDEEMYQMMKDQFKREYDKELKYHTTLIGPHRDDFVFLIDNVDIKNYGSQGQQRIAVLSLKLSEIEIFKKVKGCYPILLLDDVFSELDELKRNNLLIYIKKDMQTIITTTDLTNIDQNILEQAKIIEIDSGKIKSIEEVAKDGK